MSRSPLSRSFSIALALAAALATGGCLDTLARQGGVTTTAALPPGEAPNTSAATWQMPWQISPAAANPQAEDEEMVLAYVPQTGYVRGTRAVLAGLGDPLPAVPGPNRTVEVCRDVVRSEAVKIGAREVEAASAGPHQRGPKGEYFAPVRVRITYERLGGYEVREATMTCIIDRAGNIVDAFAG